MPATLERTGVAEFAAKDEVKIEGACACCLLAFSGTARRSKCPLCDECRSCCHCKRLGGRRVPTRCHTVVDSHEVYAEDDEIAARKMHASRPRFWQGQPDPDLPPGRHVACEIEVSGLKLSGDAVDAAVRSWLASAVGDGSLPCNGVEICTAPASGQLFRQQVSEITAALREQKALAGADCGLHVHVNATDLGPQKMMNLVDVYAAVELALYECQPASRRSNDYCKMSGPHYLGAAEKAKGGPGSPTKKFRTLVYGDLTDDQVKRAMRDKYGGERYRGVNLHSRSYRGTVEFRMGAGTSEFEKVFYWGATCAWVVHAAATWNRADVARLKSLPPWDALQSVIPSAVVVRFLRYRRAKFAAEHEAKAAEMAERERREAYERSLYELQLAHEWLVRAMIPDSTPRERLLTMPLAFRFRVTPESVRGYDQNALLNGARQWYAQDNGLWFGGYGSANRHNLCYVSRPPGGDTPTRDAVPPPGELGDPFRYTVELPAPESPPVTVERVPHPALAANGCTCTSCRTDSGPLMVRPEDLDTNICDLTIRIREGTL